jgi:predicted transcriptional regulator of viral defense system
MVISNHPCQDLFRDFFCDFFCVFFCGGANNSKSALSNTTEIDVSEGRRNVLRLSLRRIIGYCTPSTTIQLFWKKAVAASTSLSHHH